MKKLFTNLKIISCLRSDEDDASGGKYARMEEDNIQDKERFARYWNNILLIK